MVERASDYPKRRARGDDVLCRCGGTARSMQPGKSPETIRFETAGGIPRAAYERIPWCPPRRGNGNAHLPFPQEVQRSPFEYQRTSA